MDCKSFIKNKNEGVATFVWKPFHTVLKSGQEHFKLQSKGQLFGDWLL